MEEVVCGIGGGVVSRDGGDSGSVGGRGGEGRGWSIIKDYIVSMECV